MAMSAGSLADLSAGLTIHALRQMLLGDLIIPVLDPEPGSDDCKAFVRWVISAVMDEPDGALLEEMEALTRGYSAAAYAALRSMLKAKVTGGAEPGAAMVCEVVSDLIPADIGAARRYQALQAMLNCTRRSLLPVADIDETIRQAWRNEAEAIRATLRG